MIFLVLYILFFVMAIIFLIKNFITYHWHTLIVDAIFWYHMSAESILEREQREKLVCYNDLESYDATLFRFWDWGYKHILPKEKFVLLEPYIKKVKKIRKDKTDARK